MSTVSVLAGGWSVREIKDQLHRLPGHVIAVNGWPTLAPKVDEFVSMDRLWTEHFWPDLCRLQKPTWLRNACLPNIHERPDWLNVYMCDWQSAHLAAAKGILNGTNSGLVALNRAYQIAQPGDRVILFGFDMGRSPKGEPYWYPVYPWRPKGGTSEGKYREWAAQFKPAAEAFQRRGVEVLNASPASRIPAFTKVDPKKVLA